MIFPQRHTVPPPLHQSSSFDTLFFHLLRPFICSFSSSLHYLPPFFTAVILLLLSLSLLPSFPSFFSSLSTSIFFSFFTSVFFFLQVPYFLHYVTPFFSRFTEVFVCFLFFLSFHFFHFLPYFLYFPPIFYFIFLLRSNSFFFFHFFHFLPYFLYFPPIFYLIFFTPKQFTPFFSPLM